MDRLTVDDLLGSSAEATESDAGKSKVKAPQHDMTKNESAEMYDLLRSIDARLARIESKLK